MRYLILFFAILIMTSLSVKAQDGNPFGEISDPMVHAKEKLIRAKGHYETIKQQERALQDVKKATKLSLKASKLREKAEKLQASADALANKATQTALSRGLYITTPIGRSNDSGVPQPPPQDALTRSASAPPSAAPIPGQPVNIFIPPPQQTAYEQSNSFQTAPVPGF